MEIQLPKYETEIRIGCRFLKTGLSPHFRVEVTEKIYLSGNDISSIAKGLQLRSANSGQANNTVKTTIYIYIYVHTSKCNINDFLSHP